MKYMIDKKAFNMIILGTVVVSSSHRKELLEVSTQYRDALADLNESEKDLVNALESIKMYEESVRESRSLNFPAVEWDYNK